jgi:trehalose synthase
MGAIIKKELGVRAIWRSHIGLREETRATQEAWEFLMPWLGAYDRTVFSLGEYVPSLLSGRADIIYPTVEPLDHKNRELSIHELTCTLTSAALAASTRRSLNPSFDAPALRLQRDGLFAPATQPEDLGLVFRSIVTQISRWDHLKGFVPLLQGFPLLKERGAEQRTEQNKRRLGLTRLVLAGPDPEGVQDDPEAQEVLREVCEVWRGLSPELQRDVAVVKLPMVSPEENALMVNALQRCSSVVAQNSLQEGFGLTVTEAMWKARPVLGTHVDGIHAQVTDGEHGRLVGDPENPEEIAAKLGEMLVDEEAHRVWDRNARFHATEHALIFTQLRRGLGLWLDTAPTPSRAGREDPRLKA